MAASELDPAVPDAGAALARGNWTGALDALRSLGARRGLTPVELDMLARAAYGAGAEAEREALEACRDMRPWRRREFSWPLAGLGVIGPRGGDLAGAEAVFLEAHEHGWGPQPELALLRLAEGDVTAARALIDDALEHPCALPSEDWVRYGELRTAPLLAAQVEIVLAAGDIVTARSAAGRLSEIATTYRSPALAAAASLAHGRVRVGEGDAAAALRCAADALAGWSEVGAPYECASARLVLAQAHRLAGRVDRAELEEDTARATLDRIGASSTHLPQREPLADRGRCVFRLDGDTRTVSFGGQSVLLQDLKGMHHLARLLAAPDREFHVLDLTAGEGGDAARADGNDAGPVLDDQARAAYKRRLTEIDEDLDEAAGLGDTERTALARAERDHLVRELAGAFGLRGRHRMTCSPSERARGSVTRALRYSFARIAQHHPQLADHLGRTVRTGTYCCYGPDPRMGLRWEL